MLYPNWINLGNADNQGMNLKNIQELREFYDLLAEIVESEGGFSELRKAQMFQALGESLNPFQLELDVVEVPKKLRYLERSIQLYE